MQPTLHYAPSISQMMDTQNQHQLRPQSSSYAGSYSPPPPPAPSSNTGELEDFSPEIPSVTGSIEMSRIFALSEGDTQPDGLVSGGDVYFQLSPEKWESTS